MESYHQTLGNVVRLKSLTATDLTTNAYVNNFISLNAVEPSLGRPSSISNANPLSAYYFPVLGTETSYLSSRRITGKDTLYVKGSALYIPGSAIINNLSANTAFINRLSANDAFIKNLTASNTFFENITAKNGLITNLTSSIDALKELYWKRWKVEIHFKESKYNLSFEFFDNHLYPLV
jgi:hypothetical protein